MKTLPQEGRSLEGLIKIVDHIFLSQLIIDKILTFILYVLIDFFYRKRKFKKMIVDPDVKFPSQMTSSCSQSSSSEKRRNTRHSASMPR